MGSMIDGRVDELRRSNPNCYAELVGTAGTGPQQGGIADPTAITLMGGTRLMRFGAYREPYSALKPWWFRSLYEKELLADGPDAVSRIARSALALRENDASKVLIVTLAQHVPAFAGHGRATSSEIVQIYIPGLSHHTRREERLHPSALFHLPSTILLQRPT